MNSVMNKTRLAEKKENKVTKEKVDSKTKRIN